jgi:hypothetical protein
MHIAAKAAARERISGGACPCIGGVAEDVDDLRCHRLEPIDPTERVEHGRAVLEERH